MTHVTDIGRLHRRIGRAGCTLGSGCTNIELDRCTFVSAYSFNVEVLKLLD